MHRATASGGDRSGAVMGPSVTSDVVTRRPEGSPRLLAVEEVVKRAFAALASAALLVALIPVTVSAAKPTKFTDHSIEAFCDGPFDGGFASAGLFTSTQFGDSANADVWLDPAVPFEEPPAMTGSTEVVEHTEGLTEITLEATFPVFDAEGTELGGAVLIATLQPVGDPETVQPTLGKSNHHSRTNGTRQPLEGTATLSLPGLDLSFPSCSGFLTDVSVFETNPHSFVSSSQGVVVDCFWDLGEGSFASFFAFQDQVDFFADASLTTPGLVLSGSGESSGSVIPTAVSTTIGLVDRATDEPHMAIATGTFTNIGRPVTSTLVFQDGRTRTTQQALAAHGTLAFDTGDSFVMDAEHCRANTFDAHSHNNTSSGPKPGAAPANDAPDGAIRLTKKTKPNLLTGGAALEPEVPITTCPQGPFDAMGHTVWYTIIGTGAPITIDTSASDFDTLAAAYVSDSGELTEVACTDDVEFVPIGASLQAVLTFDTEVGVEYYIQVGGFKNFFSEGAESGRLRLVVR